MQEPTAVLRVPQKATVERRQVRNWQPVVLVATAGVVLYLVLTPLAIALLSTFREQGRLPLEAGAFTLDNYTRVFLNPSTWGLLVNTVVFAGGSLALGVSLAVGLGWLVERSDLPFRGLLFSLIIAPMAIPGMLSAIAWIFLLDPRIGLTNLMLRGLVGSDAAEGPISVYTLGGMVFVEGIRMVPTIFLMIGGAFRSMDPSLEEASRVAGKSAPATFFRITLPLMWPAILAAMLYYFIVAVEAFEVPGVLGMSAGIQVFSTRIYWAVAPAGGGMADYGLASTLGLILVAMSVFLIWLYNRVTGNTRRFVTVTGKGFRPRRVSLGRWKYPAVLVCAGYFFLALALPLFILIWASVHKFYSPPSLAGLRTVSFQPYLDLPGYSGIPAAMGNTLVLMVLTATATMAISLFVGWFTVRHRSRLTRVLDTVSFLPQALPSIVVALAVMLFYLSFPNPLYGTILIIAIAMTTRYLAYGSRTMGAGFLQIHPELEEASRIAGASWWRGCWRVIVPLSAPVLINGWLWVAIHAARELSVSLMLFSPKSVVISTQVWAMWNAGRVPNAAALGVVLVLALALTSWLGRLALGRIRSF